MYRIIVAIDGFSSCGKSTTARKVAENLGYAYVDTGAMYRAVTMYFVQHHVTLTNPREVAGALAGISVTFRRNSHNQANETFLNGLNVEEEIRKMYISEKVSQVSAIPGAVVTRTPVSAMSRAPWRAIHCADSGTTCCSLR